VGSITPSDISLLPQNFYGQATVPSVQTGDTVLYSMWGGRKIRDLVYQFQYDKYVGNELTVSARQIIPFGVTVTRMAFAPEPFGLLYVVRSDGIMAVCTYLPEQQVTAWSLYETAGVFEDVSVMPENNSYSVYVIVRRVISGASVRYIERFAAREVATNDDYFFVDSGLTYDGRNAAIITMAVTGGTTWLAGDVGTITATGTATWVGFQAADVVQGNQIWLYDASGNRARVVITAIVAVFQATVRFVDPLPTTLQGAATYTWTFARTYFTGANNLIGMSVAIYADAATQAPITVDLGGGITLNQAAGVLQAGLPYTSMMTSMNLNVVGQETIRNHAKTMNRLSVVVDQSLPFSVGPSYTLLAPAAIRQYEAMGAPITPHSGVIHIQMPNNEPSDDAYVCVVNSNPTPLTVLSWIVDVELGEAG
jgi:hypothetical protein